MISISQRKMSRNEYFSIKKIQAEENQGLDQI